MSNNKLFVHGFRPSISIEDRKAMIINLFSQYGNIKIDPRTGEEAINFVKDKEQGEGVYKNFCFVEMEDQESAESIVQNCDGEEFSEFGKVIKISVSIAQDRVK